MWVLSKGVQHSRRERNQAEEPGKPCSGCGISLEVATYCGENNLTTHQSFNFQNIFQALNFLRMSARVDAVASRVQTAVTTKRVTSSMNGVVKAMDSAMKSMNLEKISGLMDKFEKDFEDLDVQTSVMEGAMSQTTATNVPQDAVEGLMKQAADEAGLELNMELPGAATNTIGTTVANSTTEQDELSQRLSRLRND